MSDVKSKVNLNKMKYNQFLFRFNIIGVLIYLILLYPTLITGNNIDIYIFSSLLYTLIIAVGCIENRYCDFFDKLKDLFLNCIKVLICMSVYFLAAISFRLDSFLLMFGLCMCFLLMSMLIIKFNIINIIMNIFCLIIIFYLSFAIINKDITYINFKDGKETVVITDINSRYFTINIFNIDTIQRFSSKAVSKDFKDIQPTGDLDNLYGWSKIEVSARSNLFNKSSLIDLSNFSKLEKLPEKLLLNYDSNIDKKLEILRYLQKTYPNLVFEINALKYLAKP